MRQACFVGPASAAGPRPIRNCGPLNCVSGFLGEQSSQECPLARTQGLASVLGMGAGHGLTHFLGYGFLPLSSTTLLDSPFLKASRTASARGRWDAMSCMQGRKG